MHRPYGRNGAVAGNSIPSPGGSDPSAASGRRSEVSEWQRSTDAKALCRRRQMSGTATGEGGPPRKRWWKRNGEMLIVGRSL